MKELKVFRDERGRYYTEAAIADHERVMLQVDGCGRFVVQLSLEGEEWSDAIDLHADKESQTTIFDVCPNTRYRVAAVKGHIESVKAVEADYVSGGGGSTPTDFDFGDADSI